MVCEKLKSSNHDFKKDSLKLRIIDDEFVYATDTTLGADDGISLAYGLARASSNRVCSNYRGRNSYGGSY